MSINSKRILPLLIIFFGFLFSHTNSFAQSKIGGLMLTADKTYRDMEKGIIKLVGNVKLAIGDQYLSCDKATVNERKKTSGC